MRRESAEKLERLADWLDSVFEILEIKMRFGVDALLGPVPGVGDTAPTLASVHILSAATRLGISRIALARMTLRIFSDLAIGAIPLIGDVFDDYWKANRRSVGLPKKHLRANPVLRRKLNWSDGMFVAGTISKIVVVLVASLVGAFFVSSWLVSSQSRG